MLNSINIENLISKQCSDSNKRHNCQASAHTGSHLESSDDIMSWVLVYGLASRMTNDYGVNPTIYAAVVSAASSSSQMQRPFIFSQGPSSACSLGVHPNRALILGTSKFLTAAAVLKLNWWQVHKPYEAHQLPINCTRLGGKYILTEQLSYPT